MKNLWDSAVAQRVIGVAELNRLAKELVELHGGHLRIDSELGRGTTVTITLPPERTVVELAEKVA